MADWCLSGRVDENGKIPKKYLHLKEISGNFKSKKENYNARTIKNIKDSDGTLIIAPTSHTAKNHRWDFINYRRS